MELQLDDMIDAMEFPEKSEGTQLMFVNPVIERPY